MKTIRRYITLDFLVTFFVALAILTFVMTIGVVFKATELLGHGISWVTILKFLASGMPATLTFSIPVAVVTSSLLVFGRISADGEITAMRACGIGMWRIMAGPLAVAALLTLLCLYVNNDLSPRSHFARRSMLTEFGAESVVDLLEEGRFIQDFPGLTVYISRKNGADLQDVRIYDLRTDGVRREVRAARGRIRESGDGKDIVIELEDVRVDPLVDGHPGYCDKLPLRIEDALRRRKYRKREKDMTGAELIQRIQNVSAFYPHLNGADRSLEVTELLVELNKRLALAAGCIAFALLGIPLGVKANRKESSIGVGISLFLVFNFYLFIIMAESMSDKPIALPHIIVWIPCMLSVILGVRLVERIN
ncbi:MAG: LptF/LptG family permease [Kiritimatiellia bacterium]|nr:LptF/LptG family permease [Kiritimatiellia bacterium]